ncbi:DUF2933 domain-containing protein [Aromatoleum evansii]|nr:DUF2933 domain-containing protein [Aromatoleum evansii]
MHAHDHPTRTTSKTPSNDTGTRRARWVFGGFAVIGATLLILEHRTHVLGILPWLFLLACPLMHLFMHHGHGGHGHGGSGEPKDGGKE